MKRFATVTGLALAFAVFGLNRCAAADKPSADDVKFLKEAASGGMLEVKLGELASKRAHIPAVRKFGDRMVSDHSKANKQLMDLADRKGLKIPKELNKKDQDMMNRLKDLKDNEFDVVYMKEMVKDHENDVKEFADEAKKASDPDVRDFAAKTLPTLKEHLEMARETAAKVDRNR